MENFILTGVRSVTCATHVLAARFLKKIRGRGTGARTRSLALWLSLSSAALTAAGADSRTQTIELTRGWNAVFLEVQPAVSRPEEIFRGLSIETVACFVPGSLDEQYLRTPGDAPWKQEGWAVWYWPSRPEAFLSNLYEVHSHRPYLIRATEQCTWRVTGLPSTRSINWYPNTCTLTGLPVDAEAPPTFKEFFSGSEAHQRLRIFRLEGGNWKLVQDPATARPRSGEAFWIQTDGASSYQGPLRVKVAAFGEIDFDLGETEKSLEFYNEGPSVARVRIESITDSDSLSLQIIDRDLSRRSVEYRPLPPVLELPVLPGSTGTVVRLALDRAALLSESVSTVLKISDGRGTQQWLPVRARRTLAAAQ